MRIAWDEVIYRVMIIAVRTAWAPTLSQVEGCPGETRAFPSAPGWALPPSFCRQGRSLAQQRRAPCGRAGRRGRRSGPESALISPSGLPVSAEAPGAALRAHCPARTRARAPAGRLLAAARFLPAATLQGHRPRGFVGLCSRMLSSKCVMPGLDRQPLWAWESGLGRHPRLHCCGAQWVTLAGPRALQTQFLV